MARDRTARVRIKQFLAAYGPVVDPSGYATAILKDAIRYDGSSVAFIQLIAAMDTDGEIEREIRGKRTYKITGTAAADVASVFPSSLTSAGATAIAVPGQPLVEIDYKKLAQALLAELLHGAAPLPGQPPRS